MGALCGLGGRPTVTDLLVDLVVDLEVDLVAGFEIPLFSFV